jgi:glycerol-3-phosphate dehydrogenase (NAD+)
LRQIAQQKEAETTVGARDRAHGELLARLISAPYFSVNVVSDVAGVETSGALKNIVALACGFCDGLERGSNAKAAILRRGVLEMFRFTQLFFPDVSLLTYFESCGFADAVVTGYSGRNRRTAEAFVREGKPFAQLETELLGGQKLQGPLTADEAYRCLKARGQLDAFPLFVTVYEIAFCNLDPAQLMERLWREPQRNKL